MPDFKISYSDRSATIGSTRAARRAQQASGAWVDTRGRESNLGGMSLAEITSAIDRLSAEERAVVSAHLRRRFLEDSPERRTELAAIRDDMEQGRRFTLGELKKRHEELAAEGR